MKRYIKSSKKKLNYVRTPEGEDPTIRYSVYGFKNPGENASLTRSEDFTSLRGALKFASSISDTYYRVVIRKDTIYDRDYDTDISSSGPIVIFTDGVPEIAKGLKEPYKSEVRSAVSKYIDIQ